jgi:hypothetical protein
VCERPHIDTAIARPVESDFTFSAITDGAGEMLGRRFVRCSRCRLRWIPQSGKAGACPACGSKEVKRRLEPFHLGVLLLALAAGAGAVELRASATPAAESARVAPRTGRVVARQLTLAAEAGPRRGKKVRLRRGDVVQVRARHGETLLVEDARGNQVRLKLKHVELR